MRGITRQDVVQYYQRHFVQGNVDIAFSGDVDETKAAEISQRLVSRLEAYRRTTRSDLLRVARRYLVKERRTIVDVRPELPAGDG